MIVLAFDTATPFASNFTFLMSTFATKNFDLSRMYGASAWAAPCGTL